MREVAGLNPGGKVMGSDKIGNDLPLLSFDNQRGRPIAHMTNK